jgi:hypothetical protein
LSKKLVHFCEDFSTGTFTLEKTGKTVEELLAERGEHGDDSTVIESAKKSSSKALIKPTIEAIHAGATKNFTFYGADKLKGDAATGSGVFSWLAPYPKPMLTHHNSYSGEPIGRITDARFDTKTNAGRPAIIVNADIVDPDAAQKVRDGRYLTVSIGAHTDSVTCSICGWDILEDDWCPEHDRGKKYDGETALWVLGNLWFDELSYVDVPADQDAMNVSIEDDSEVSTKEAQEMDDDKKVTEGAKETPESTDTTVTETVEKTTDPEVTPTEESMDDKVKRLVMEALASAKIEKPAETNESTETNEEMVKLQAKVDELTSEVESLKAEKAELSEKATELQAKIHTSLAERVVDLKVALGKAIEDRDAAVNDHAERTEESLNDALKDLLEEAKTYGVAYRLHAEAVTNPVAGAVPGEANATIVDGTGKRDEKVEAAATASSKEALTKNLKSMFTR